LSVSLTVPSASQVLPALPVAKNPSNTETNAAVISTARNCAAAHLRQKNRRGKQMTVTFPGAQTSLESATNYRFEGFSPAIDNAPAAGGVGVWTLDDLEIKFTKSGAQTIAHFHLPPAF
jgi:hypothetical protein